MFLDGMNCSGRNLRQDHGEFWRTHCYAFNGHFAGIGAKATASMIPETNIDLPSISLLTTVVQTTPASRVGMWVLPQEREKQNELAKQRGC
jgi:hypothetical protein